MMLPPEQPFRLQSPSLAKRPADKLRELAAYVLRLGQRGCSDPETFVVAKGTIASEMRKLARELGQ